VEDGRAGMILALFVWVCEFLSTALVDAFLCHGGVLIGRVRTGGRWVRVVYLITLERKRLEEKTLLL
jgi:hypothetical protein